MKKISESYSKDELLPSCRVVEGAEGAQGTPEWLQFKSDKIGSSQAPAIMGKSPYETPLQLYDSIVQFTEKPVTRAMQMGKEEEPKALAWFNQLMQRPFEPKVVQSVDYPFLIASLDGFYVDNGEPTGCEIKYVNVEDALIAIEGAVPEKHLWQIHHQMLVTGAKEWWYISWTGIDGIVVRVTRNNDAIQELLAKEINFQLRLEKLDPPEPQERDWKSLDIIEHLALEYKRWDEAEKNAVKKKEALKKEIVSCAMKVHTRVKVKDILKIEKRILQGRVDYDAIPELKGVDVDQYRKDPIVSWRLE